MHFRDIFENILGKEDAYECALWAFGQDFENILRENLPLRWNSIHSDLFIIDPNNQIESDIKKICAYWIINKDKKHPSVCF